MRGGQWNFASEINPRARIWANPAGGPPARTSRRQGVDMRTEGVEQREAMGKTARGRKDKNREDGQPIVKENLQRALRDLGHLAEKARQANTALQEAEKAVAKKSGMTKAVVHRMVKAHSGDLANFEDAKRMSDQLAIAFEIPYEGEITKTAIETNATKQ